MSLGYREGPGVGIAGPASARRIGFTKGLLWLPRVRFVALWLLRLSVILAALSPIVTYLRVALSRIAFPFDNEWMEGTMVDTVGRVLSGQGIYVEPSLEFTPFIYNPVFYYVSAAVAAVVGLDYAALRGVSFAASLVSLGLLFEICRRETGSVASGAVAAGVFAATFKLSGAWFDIGRVDSLAVAWCLLAAYCVRFGERSRTLALGGLFAALMFGTKQSLLPLIPLFLLYLAVFEGRRKALVFGGTAIGVSLLSMLVLNVTTDGWYLRYTFLYPRGHDMDFIKLREWQLETSGSLIFAFALALAFLLSGASLKARAFYGGMGVSLIWLAWYSRVHGLSYLNVNMPAHVAIALLAGLGLSAFEQRDLAAAACAVVAIVFQFELLRYNPREFMPNVADQVAVHSLRAVIRSFDGEVFLPQHGFVAAREGRGTFVHDIAATDVERTTGAPDATRGRIRKQVADAIAKRRFAAVIMDWDTTGNMPGLARYYRRAPFDLGPPSVLKTRVGFSVRPSVLWVPREPRARRARHP